MILQSLLFAQMAFFEMASAFLLIIFYFGRPHQLVCFVVLRQTSLWLISWPKSMWVDYGGQAVCRWRNIPKLFTANMLNWVHGMQTETLEYMDSFGEWRVRDWSNSSGDFFVVEELLHTHTLVPLFGGIGELLNSQQNKLSCNFQIRGCYE